MKAVKRSWQMQQTHRLALCGMLTAAALVFSYVEALIPINFGIPGIKLGLANLVVLAGLYRMKPGEVLMISMARILAVGFLFGSGMSIIYSLAGGLISFCVMLLLIRSGHFSMIGISIAGGVSHNIGQLLIAALVVKTLALAWYLPALMIAGLISGTLMGIVTEHVLSRMKRGAAAW